MRADTPVPVWAVAIFVAVCVGAVATAIIDAAAGGTKHSWWQAHRAAVKYRHQRDHLQRLLTQHVKAERRMARVSRPTVFYSIRVASALYGVPEREMRSVASCETGGTFSPWSKNPSSTASGLFQFLDSTWARAGIPGFSVFDPFANALAAARLVVADGGWREWTCQP